MIKKHIVKIGNVEIGGDSPLTLIAGPCVVESYEITLEIASTLKQICKELNIGFVFKASVDKANRTNIDSFRGHGFEEGLKILQKVKSELNVPIISDVHETYQIPLASKVLDALQIPALLARQTDLLIEAAKSGLPVNIKKGQFMAPEDMKQVVNKLAFQPLFNGLTLCERGTFFGYHNLVVDMRSLAIMRQFDWPVIFDATHSVQLPSAVGACSGGDRQYIPYLSRAAVAVGVDGLFMETHPEPETALCDGANSLPLKNMKDLLSDLIKIHQITRNFEKREYV